MVNHKRKLCKFSGRLTPVAQQRLHNIIMPASVGWDAQWSADNDREYWTPTGCEGIVPPPIVCPAGRPTKRRVKDHIDMIIENKVRKTCQVTCSKCGEKGHYYKICKGAPRDPN
ncbi:hypothetical protein PIB30_000288 [Stylosanthes scabra]|uniref:CCHC-type domain-containing protein n=1 Tax=Stylosanthes scabra TaxID=79078 RepID=A0ABU6T433_9FABA|nr:hypothetical protein [Stylosanthes scabra]